MHHALLHCRRWLLLLLLGLAAPTALAAGEVVFVRGKAVLVEAGGAERALKPGDSLKAGQSLRTGEDGHVHLRFADGGFVSVRPGSRFVLEAYTVDASHPEGVAIRYRLDHGVARTITGAAVERDKSRFRFNTPLAAIGVRGTDYVVQAGADFTRVSVNSGAVVLAPIGGGCEAAALGPCDTPAARSLGAVRDAYLEYRVGAVAPELKRSERNGGSPNTVSPPLPEEPRTGGNVQRRSEGPSEPVSTVIAERVNETLLGGVTPPASVVEVPPPPPPTVIWGRWSSVVAPEGAAPTVASLLGGAYRSTVGNSTYGLLVSSMPTALPREGVVGFSLAGSEAALRQGNVLSPAAIRDASLVVDFGARRFDTQLTFTHDGLVLPLSATGNVQWQGYLHGDSSRSTMDVVGVLGGANAQDAGYVFDRSLSDGTRAVGATFWRR